MRIQVDKKQAGSYVNLALESVTLERGETVTVWLNTEEKGKRLAVQLELRVTAEGVPEIFAADWAKMEVQSFKEWKPLEEAKYDVD